MKEIFRAASFAAEAHKKQTRKDANSTPYINHPLRVAELLIDSGVTDEALTARDKKDIEAIKGTIKRLQNELTNPNPNLDRNDINQRIATEKKRLGLYGIKEEVELEEALITFGGKAYPKFGTVVIQAGGAGSGK